MKVRIIRRMTVCVWCVDNIPCYYLVSNAYVIIILLIPYEDLVNALEFEMPYILLILEEDWTTTTDLFIQIRLEEGRRRRHQLH